MISAGRVLLMPKGDYDPTATYEMLDIVSYNGSSYIAKSTTTGNLPTNTTYWQLSAYGGQASNLAGNFAPLETTEYATRAYATDDIFVDKDSQLVIATTTINIGDEIEIGSNCDVTTMAELLDAIENRYDALDQRNRKLVGINPITIQTDLHLLAPGEYFKKLTNFYVTNAPTGINQVPTAIFRLTVESGLDESGSSLLLTLRTIEGEIYTQAYDGSVWSDWRKAGDVDSSDLGTAAAKDSTNEVTSGSTDLVESGAVYTEIQTLTNQVADMNNVLGAKNLLPNKAVTKTSNGVTFTVNSDGSITANGTATASSTIIITSAFNLTGGEYIFSDEANSTDANVQMLLETSDGAQRFASCFGTQREKKFTLSQAYTLRSFIWISSGTTVDNVTFKPMLRLASIQDDTYVPYSMTNREMTPYVQAISNPNLIDNPWFTVNQRGQSTYTTYAYTVDRWTFGHFNGDSPTTKSLTVSNNGITCTHDSTGNDCIQQLIEETTFKRFKQGDKYTLSFEVSGSGIVKGYVWDGSNWHNVFPSETTLTNANHQLLTTTFDMWDTSNTTQFKVVFTFRNSPNVTFHAIKLEKGTVSTLAMDTAPNYQQELAKCQRYFERVNINSQVGYPSVTASNGTMIIFTIPFKVTKRTTPSVSSDVTSIQTRIAGTAYIGSTISNGTSTVDYGNLVFSPSATAPVASSGTTIILTGSYIDFSADL